MIGSQISQYLFNNLPYGENSREQNRLDFLELLYEGEGALAKALAVSELLEPNYFRIWGIDISHWDWLVNLAVTKAKGAAFVFIKAIDGTLRTKFFVENRATALSVGLPHGPYGWLYANKNVSCVAQAQAYDALCNDYPPELRPILDFEWTNYGGVRSDPNYDDLRIWATEWLRLGNPKAILYSAPGFMNPLGKIPADVKAMFEGLHIANYGVSQPSMPYGYADDEWVYHQWTHFGNQALLAPSSANKKELDLNYEGVAINIPHPQPDGGSMYQGTTLVRLNVREVPTDAGNEPVSVMAIGTKVEADRVENGWWHLTKIAGQMTGAERWAFEGANKTYIRTDAIIDAPPAAGSVADMPYSVTFGGGDSPYQETVLSGVVKAK